MAVCRCLQIGGMHRTKNLYKRGNLSNQSKEKSLDWKRNQRLQSENFRFKASKEKEDRVDPLFKFLNLH